MSCMLVELRLVSRGLATRALDGGGIITSADCGAWPFDAPFCALHIITGVTGLAPPVTGGGLGSAFSTSGLTAAREFVEEGGV